VAESGGDGAAEADRLIARALESVLDAVPEIPGGELTPVETAPNVQPWAETAAPAGKNKRPLGELLAELEASVAAQPGARARVPGEVHPADAYLASLSGQPTAGKRSGRRRFHGKSRRRGRRGRGQPA